MSSQAVWAELPFNETSRTDLVQLQAVCLQIAALFQHLEHLGQQWYSMRLTKNSFNSRQVFGSVGCVLYSLCSPCCFINWHVWSTASHLPIWAQASVCAKSAWTCEIWPLKILPGVENVQNYWPPGFSFNHCHNCQPSLATSTIAVRGPSCCSCAFVGI